MLHISEFADGRSGRITDEPAEMAFLLNDGDDVFQRNLPDDSTDADTAVMRWDSSDGTITTSSC